MQQVWVLYNPLHYILYFILRTSSFFNQSDFFFCLSYTHTTGSICKRHQACFYYNYGSIIQITYFKKGLVGPSFILFTSNEKNGMAFITQLKRATVCYRQIVMRADDQVLLYICIYLFSGIYQLLTLCWVIGGLRNYCGHTQYVIKKQ